MSEKFIFVLLCKFRMSMMEKMTTMKPLSVMRDV